MRIIFLLSSLFSFLFSLSLYNLKNDFIIEKTSTCYRLILKGQRFINYKEINSFKFFIPYFTKNFTLKLLRYNSTGFINGYISMDNTFSKVITDNNIKYYFTDFKNGFQLTYLLKGYTIPYFKVTSISIDMKNIPSTIQDKLNKFIYFKKIPLKNNSLKYLLYSCIIELDKKRVDKFIKSHYQNGSINDFLSDIYKIDLRYKPPKQKKKIIKKHKMPYSLILTKLLFMKEYGYIPQKITINQPDISPFISNLQNSILDLQYFIKSKLNSTIIFSPKKLIPQIDKKFEKILNKLYNPPQIDIQFPKCLFNKDNIKKECFKNPIYFHNYIYYKIKNNSILDTETILAYGDYKTFNDVGKYYFEIGDFEKAEVFLQKAYILADDKHLIAHNLGVLYAFHTPLYNIKKAIKYFKEANLDIDRYNLGIFYYIGLGVKENDKIARKYFKSSLTIPYSKYNYETMKKYNVGIK